ncbi:MAG: Fe-S cluster assembly protein IscX [Phycisphaerales bacterium]
MPYESNERTDAFHWLDVDRIAEALDDAHPEVDPLAVAFPRLRELVLGLRGFHELPGHPVNERILEAIQQAWLDEREP